MSDNQISNEQYKNFLVNLATSGDPIFKAYTDKVNELAENMKASAALEKKQDFISKWQRNLEKYSQSTDSTVSQAANSVLSKFSKLANDEITVEEFKNTVSETPSETNVDLNSVNNIRKCIIDLFE